MIERLLAGDAALDRDDVEVADRLFAQVAEADPRNAIAVVGLARVAVRRGDLERARALAARALAIDPDEAAASRLLTELDRRPEAEPVRAPVAEPEPPAAAPEQPAAGQPEPEPASDPWPVPTQETVAVPPAEATAPRSGWRGWLDRLLRRR